MKNKKIIARGFGFEVYTHDNRYYLNTFKDIIHSYSTIEAIAEALYYGGYIPTKDTSALNALAI